MRHPASYPSPPCCNPMESFRGPPGFVPLEQRARERGELTRLSTTSLTVRCQFLYRITTYIRGPHSLKEDLGQVPEHAMTRQGKVRGFPPFSQRTRKGWGTLRLRRIKGG